MPMVDIRLLRDRYHHRQPGRDRRRRRLRPRPQRRASSPSKTTTPKRVSAVLELAIEDIAAVGQDELRVASFARTCQLSADLDNLDEYAINGNRPASLQSGDEVAIPDGLFKSIGVAPTDPTAIAVWADFIDASRGAP